MNLPLRNSKPYRRLRDEHGSAILVTLYFAVIAMITVFSYLFFQRLHAKPILRSPSSLQALFNARSGIYRAFYRLIDSTGTDTLRTISTLDSTFGASLFDSFPDTITPSDEKPQFDGTPVIYDLFPDDTLGEAEVALEPAGGCCLLRATGKFRSIERKVSATIGSRTPALPDTVVICRNSLAWDKTPVHGTVVAIADSLQQVNTSWFGSLVDRYLTDITGADTILFDTPLEIDNNAALGKIDSVVNGPLNIFGATVTWRDTGTVIVKGNLDISGEVLIEGVNFIVGGDIMINDNAKVIKSNLFTQGRLYINSIDLAGNDSLRFEGNAFALHSIVVNNAVVTGKSTLIAGSTGSSSSTPTSKDSLKFSIEIEKSRIDAVCIALGTPGSIRTDGETDVTGILWAQLDVCHRGRMAGLICAGRLRDCDDPLQMEKPTGSNPAGAGDSGAGKKPDHLVEQTQYNSIPGEIEPLQEIGLYHLPYFIGRLSIVAWKEE